jgi:hypothetical protein
MPYTTVYRPSVSVHPRVIIDYYAAETAAALAKLEEE